MPGETDYAEQDKDDRGGNLIFEAFPKYARFQRDIAGGR